MPFIIAFIVIAIAVSLAGVFMNGDPNVPEAEEQAQEETISQGNTSSQGGNSQGSQISSDGQQAQTSIDPNFPINTYIKYGSAAKDVFDDTTEVTFEFDAVVSDSVDLSDLYFETKAEGVDTDWKKTSQKYRKVTFPSGSHQYAFWVRGRTDELTEPSPAYHTITINVSPYYNKIKISNLKAPDNQANPSLITLSTNIPSGETINISGWTLEGEKGTVAIPKGAERYDPNDSSSWNQNILLRRGDMAYISSMSSPFAFSQLSFRPNKCMGYYADSNNFEISVSKSCPRPTADSLPSYISAKCKNFILDEIGTCEFPDTDKMNEYDLYDEDACIAYLTANFNYSGCLAKYGSDSNFTQNLWHIYTDRYEREIMDRFGDTVYLKDSSGLVAAKYCFEDYCN
ncbi:MAG: hypothetical protein WC302_00250 [Candidatus Paceibacterota bacterium]|jgi:hypothetical protein